MIGVFDSGFAGLTVHKALTRALPQHDFVFLGDNKNSPYGVRPELDVLTLTTVGVERLFAEGCRLVIVACNTASTVAMRWMQDDWLPNQQRGDGIKRNVLGVVAPTIEAALGDAPWAGANALDGKVNTIGIFATERTVLSGEYPHEIAKRRPDVKIVQQSCSGLVQLIEMGADSSAMRTLVGQFVKDMYNQLENWPDRVVLGCTHFPIIANIFAEFLPSHIPVIDQQQAVASATADYLKRHPEYDALGSGKRVYLTTGCSDEARNFAERTWGEPLTFKNV